MSKMPSDGPKSIVIKATSLFDIKSSRVALKSRLLLENVPKRRVLKISKELYGYFTRRNNGKSRKTLCGNIITKELVNPVNIILDNFGSVNSGKCDNLVKINP